MTGKIGNSDSEEDKTSPTHYRLVVRMPDGTYRVYRGIVGSGEEPLLDEEASRNPSGICQGTSKKIMRRLPIRGTPRQGLCPYASLPQDIFET